MITLAAAFIISLMFVGLWLMVKHTSPKPPADPELGRAIKQAQEKTLRGMEEQLRRHKTQLSKGLSNHGHYQYHYSQTTVKRDTQDAIKQLEEALKKMQAEEGDEPEPEPQDAAVVDDECPECGKMFAVVDDYICPDCRRRRDG